MSSSVVASDSMYGPCGGCGCNTNTESGTSEWAGVRRCLSEIDRVDTPSDMLSLERSLRRFITLTTNLAGVKSSFVIALETMPVTVQS